MSTPFLYLVGTGYNHLSRVAQAPTPGSADTVLGQVASLYDYTTEAPFLFGGTPATTWLDIDLNQVTNGGFEAPFVGGLPAAATHVGSWGKSSSTPLSRVTSGAYEGTARMEVAGAGEYAYFDLNASAGEALRITAAAACTPNGPGSAAEVLVRNLQTGRWLTALLGWSDTEAALHSVTGSSFVAKTSTFTVENFAACQVDRPVLRVYLRCTSPATAATFDAFWVWPRTTFVSVHGHNFQPWCILGVRSGSDPSAPNTRALLSIAQPSMWAQFSAVDDRYWRFASTTPTDLRQIYIRELVFSQIRTLAETHEQGAETVVVDVQERTAADIGHLRAALRTAQPRRRMRCDFKLAGPAQLDEWREIMARSRNGAHPFVVVPDSTRADSAMLCTVPPEWTRSQMRGQFTRTTIELDELPFPELVA